MIVPTVIDVSAHIQQKVAAIAAHASQFPLKQDMLPLSILQELIGREFFVRVLPPPSKSEITTDFLPAVPAAPPAERSTRRTMPLGWVLNEY